MGRSGKETQAADETPTSQTRARESVFVDATTAIDGNLQGIRWALHSAFALTVGLAIYRIKKTAMFTAPPSSALQGGRWYLVSPQRLTLAPRHPQVRESSVRDDSSIAWDAGLSENGDVSDGQQGKVVLVTGMLQPLWKCFMPQRLFRWGSVSHVPVDESTSTIDQSTLPDSASPHDVAVALFGVSPIDAAHVLEASRPILHADMLCALYVVDDDDGGGDDAYPRTAVDQSNSMHNSEQFAPGQRQLSGIVQAHPLRSLLRSPQFAVGRQKKIKTDVGAGLIASGAATTHIGTYLPLIGASDAFSHKNGLLDVLDTYQQLERGAAKGRKGAWANVKEQRDDDLGSSKRQEILSAAGRVVSNAYHSIKANMTEPTRKR